MREVCRFKEEAELALIQAVEAARLEERTNARSELSSIRLLESASPAEAHPLSPATVLSKSALKESSIDTTSTTPESSSAMAAASSPVSLSTTTEIPPISSPSLSSL